MADIKKCISINGDMTDFCLQNDLVDTISTINPDLLLDKTYVYGSKQTDYILISSALSHMIVKAGHHQFD